MQLKINFGGDPGISFLKGSLTVGDNGIFDLLAYSRNVKSSSV